MTERQSKKHSLTINGHSTSITLENEFWQSLKEIAAASGKTVNQIAAELDAQQPDNLSSALRVFILKHYKNT